jgi:serine/threonine protein kinase
MQYRLVEASPVYRMTVGLLDTYKLINTRYYEAKKAKQAKLSMSAASTGASTSLTSSSMEKSYQSSVAGKSASGGAGASAQVVEDYQVSPGELLGNGRYRVEDSLGKGSFGQVVLATDMTKVDETGVNSFTVAIKVIKNKDAFRKQAKTELKILQVMNSEDKDDQMCIVRCLEWFDHNGHTCIVFEHLSLNLYELLKKTHYRGVSLPLIRKFGRQILKALAFMLKPSIDVIHCDLKPENILFRQPNRSAVKVIDFGSSCHSGKTMYKYIQSRFYRSPEVILELPYNQAIDMWSLGCILVEMHTGMPLFSGRNETDQMYRFFALKSIPPLSMLQASKKTFKFFDLIKSENESIVNKMDIDVDINKSMSDEYREDKFDGASYVSYTPGGDSDWDQMSAISDNEMMFDKSGIEDITMTDDDALDAIIDSSLVHGSDDVALSRKKDGSGRRKSLVSTSSSPSKTGRKVPQTRSRMKEQKDKLIGSTTSSHAASSQRSSSVTSSHEKSSSLNKKKRLAENQLQKQHAISDNNAALINMKQIAALERLHMRAFGKQTSLLPRKIPSQVSTQLFTMKPKAELDKLHPPSASSHKEPALYTDLVSLLGVHIGGPTGRRKNDPEGHSPAQYALFLDIVDRMIAYDPKMRIKPLEAMNHPFFFEDVVSQG